MMSTPRTELTEEAPADSVNLEADNGSQKSAKVWLRLLPEHWDLARLKFLCRRSAIYGANIPASEYVSDGVRFLRTTDIDDRGNLTEDDPVFVERAQIDDYLLSDGDLLLSRSGTLGRSFLYRSSRHGECAYAGYLVRFVPGELLNPKFLFFFTKSAGFKVWLARETIESTIGNVSGRKFASLPVPLPPTPEQEDITRFLESGTRRIDDLIAKKERLIELLEEKRTALITQAVTKGLDPDVPMKDSGVEWLGEIPEGWKVTKLRWLLSYLTDGTHGSHSRQQDGIPLLSAENIRKGQLHIDANVRRITKEEHREITARSHPKPGDVLLTIVGTLGRAAVLDTDAPLAFQRSVAMLRPGTTIQSEYLRLVTQAAWFQHRLMARSKRSAQSGVYLSDLARMVIPVPPIGMQGDLAQHLRDREKQVERIRAAILEAINRLQEYRSAIITEAVTGKIDVRDHAA